MNWYDRAEVYDILCGWDPGTERDFVLGASRRWGIPDPGRILEPFCGSGRLLRALPGRTVGLDVNRNMLRYAARTSLVFRADAARFGVRAESFDLALNLIDSFRYLRTEAEARSHLRCVARALRPGAVYVLGLDVTGDLPGGDVSVEEWEMERGGVRVAGRVRALGDADPGTRLETFQVVLRIRRPGAAEETIESFQPMRVYSRAQLRELLAAEGSFELAACFDRRYRLDEPVDFDTIAGSAVLVLRRRD